MNAITPDWRCLDDDLAAMPAAYPAVRDAHTRLSDTLCDIESGVEAINKIALWVERINDAFEADEGHAAYCHEYTAKLASALLTIADLETDAKALLRMNGQRA